MLVGITLIYLLVVMSSLFQEFVYVDIVMVFTQDRLVFLKKKKDESGNRLTLKRWLYLNCHQGL